MRRSVAVLGAAAVLWSGLVLVAPASSASTPTPKQVPMTTAKAYDGSPLQLGAVTLSPGRVTWSDNSVKGGAIWTRVLTRTSVGFTAGPVHKLGTGMPTQLSASGSRTAWIAGGSVVIRSGYSTTALPGSFTGLRLSGLRLMAYGADQLVLFDLRTGARTDVAATYAATAAALWGDDLVYAKSDRSVWAVNLATGTTRQIDAPRPDSALYGFDMGANRVAWMRTYADPNYPECGGTEVVIVDLRTGQRPVDEVGGDYLWPGGWCESGHTEIAGLGVDGWQRVSWPLSDSVNYADDPSYYLRPWDGTGEMALPGPGEVDGAYWAGGHLSNVRGGWVALPRVGLLPRPVGVATQSLGNVVAPAAAKRGATWSLAAVVSAVVHTCHVDITTPGGKAVRALDCQQLWRQGEIRATWDGKRADGSYVPVGTYRWRIVAGNGTQPLLSSDGSATPITGTVAVS